jgi:hypothetical protein
VVRALFESAFPNLAAEGFSITSPRDPTYNCIAWAAGDSDHWWWPDAYGVGYWPEGVERSVTIEAFVEAYRSLGFEPCRSRRLEQGFEKVAIYADASGAPTHAARQLPDGRWTSKLGQYEDIEHSLRGLSHGAYGTVRRVLRRALTPAPQPYLLPAKETTTRS